MISGHSEVCLHKIGGGDYQTTGIPHIQLIHTLVTIAWSQAAWKGKHETYLSPFWLGPHIPLSLKKPLNIFCYFLDNQFLDQKNLGWFLSHQFRRGKKCNILGKEKNISWFLEKCMWKDGERVNKSIPAHNDYPVTAVPLLCHKSNLLLLITVFTLKLEFLPAAWF